MESSSDLSQRFVVSNSLKSTRGLQNENSFHNKDEIVRCNNPFNFSCRQATIGFIGTTAFQLKNYTRVNENSIMLRKNDSFITNEHIYRQHEMPYTSSRLKDSTKKLLSLLEELRSKTTTLPAADVYTPKIAKTVRPIFSTEDAISDQGNTDIDACAELNQLEAQTKQLSNIHIEDEDNDCSVYKRLTRKCHCLNKQEYNDFIIHFNDNPHYATTNMGEVIKNIKILKKFLTIGNSYTKNALMFLNQGFQESSYSEKVEITQACAHADICSVFEDKSIVAHCLFRPIRNEYYDNAAIQWYAAKFINQLAQVEEGRRYLNYTTRLKSDIRKILRSKDNYLESDILESLEHTLKLLEPSISNDNNCTTYYSKLDEGFGYRTIQHLSQYRHYMTLDEILTNLDSLKKFSLEAKGNAELRLQMPSLLALFITILNEYNNSEMNILIAAIVNNIVSQQALVQNAPKTVTYANIATEAIGMKTQTSQIPEKKLASKKNKCRKINNSRVSLDVSQRRFRTDLSPVIMVPLEKKTRSSPLRSILRSTTNL